MGHKVHPTGIRLGITTRWKSNWYAERATYRENLGTDLELSLIHILTLPTKA